MKRLTLLIADSALLVLSGLRNEKEGDQGSHFYRIDGDRFVLVRDMSRNNLSGRFRRASLRNTEPT
jgi:hypothetical protein